MIVYADTSALAKLLVEEQGTQEMLALRQVADPLITASIAYVELRSAAAAAIRQGRVPATGREVLIGQVEQLWNVLSKIPLGDHLLWQAGELAERMRLRAYDAVHLAALVETGGPGEMTFACWDNDLRRAAHDLGYQVVPG